MFTAVAPVILAFALLWSATDVRADEFQLVGPGDAMSSTAADADCAGSPVAGALPRAMPRPAAAAVPVSESTPRQAATRMADPIAATPARPAPPATHDDDRTYPRSAEPAVAPKPRGAMRWQSVLPGSIK